MQSESIIVQTANVLWKSLHSMNTLNAKRSTVPLTEKKLWALFGTHANYEYVKIDLATGLNVKKNSKLISLINHSIASGEMKFTLTSSADLEKGWETASSKQTVVGQFIFLIPLFYY